jgi:hypothetical protein
VLWKKSLFYSIIKKIIFCDIKNKIFFKKEVVFDEGFKRNNNRKKFLGGVFGGFPG